MGVGLMFVFAAAVIGILALAVPDDRIHTYPDSGGYLRVAERLMKFEPGALAERRGFVYPLIVSVHKATGLSHFFTVSFFNLSSLALLAWGLFKRGWRIPACTAGGLGIFLLFSHVNLGFATSYLRESIVLGVTALHLAVLVEAVLGPWPVPGRIGLVAVSLLVLYHWKAMYLFPFFVAGPFWIWAALRQAGLKWPFRTLVFSIFGTILMAAGTWATNPNNDAAIRGCNLIGELLRSPAPAFYANKPEIVKDDKALEALRFMAWCQANLRGKEGYTSGDGEVNPYLVEPLFKERFGSSLWDQATRIYLLLALNDPGRFLLYVTKRAWIVVGMAFEKGEVCSQPLGERTGLPGVVCKPIAWVVFYMIPIAMITALVMLFVRREQNGPVLALVCGVCAMLAVLVSVIAVASYNAFDRLFFPGLVYSLLGLPIAVFGIISTEQRFIKPTIFFRTFIPRKSSRPD